MCPEEITEVLVLLIRELVVHRMQKHELVLHFALLAEPLPLPNSHLGEAFVLLPVHRNS